MSKSSRARCRLCNENIAFTKGNPVELGFHMIDRHSSGSVVQYSIHEEEKVCPADREEVCPPQAENTCTRECPRTSAGRDECECARPVDCSCNKPVHECSCDKAGKRAWDTMKKFSSGKRTRRKKRSNGLYKTTLETWTAGGCRMICPCCKQQVKPLIKTQKNKVAFTSLGATFLLSCWPFCFMFPLHHKCAMDLYCPLCKMKLGMFDSSSCQYKTNAGVVLCENVPNIRKNR